MCEQGCEFIGIIDNKCVHPIVAYAWDNKRHEDGVQARKDSQGRFRYLMPVEEGWGKQVGAYAMVIAHHIVPSVRGLPDAKLVACAVRQPDSGKSRSGKIRRDTPQVKSQLVRFLVCLRDESLGALAHTMVFNPKPINKAVAAGTIAWPPGKTFRGCDAPASFGEAVVAESKHEEARRMFTIGSDQNDDHNDGYPLDDVGWQWHGCVWRRLWHGSPDVATPIGTRA